MSFLKAKIKLSFSNQGFTLIELFVTSFIVILVITVAIGVFVSSVTGEKEVTRIKTVEDNARYAMETMSREIRTAQEITSPPGVCSNSLDFFSSTGFPQRYGLDSQKLMAGIGLNSRSLTSSEVNVSELVFCVNDFVGEDVQPRVTIAMNIESVSDPSSSISLQTTVSIMSY
ncbi:hypothetical protein AMJ48_00105 [Parcubacteria bacterium DG_74_1]|nr:MAG: hypothetical protein AMJ48_00105 [Parcubacteria bacterium DG_74_1]